MEKLDFQSSLFIKSANEWEKPKVPDNVIHVSNFGVTCISEYYSCDDDIRLPKH